MSADATMSGMGGYPVRYDVEYPEKLSRLLIFVKWLLALPHLLILYALTSVAGILTLFAFFSILFTKKYPRGMFDFVVNIYRWQANVYAYIGLMRDEYPPFSWDPGPYHVTYEVDYPQEMSRWLIFVKWLLIIPHLIVLTLLLVVALVLWIVAFFAILITGRFPRGIFDFLVGTARWSNRITAYLYLLTDSYPPSSMK